MPKARKISELLNTQQEPGLYNLNFEVNNLVSGMYVLKITSDQGSISRKLMVE